MRLKKYLGAVLALAMLLSVMPATTALANEVTPPGLAAISDLGTDLGDPDVRYFYISYDEAGTIKFVVQPDDYEQPTKDQVAAGQDAKGNPAALSGQVNYPTAVDWGYVDFDVSDLAAGKYDVFCICEDAFGHRSDVTTPPLPPTAPAGEPNFELMGQVTFAVTDSTTTLPITDATVSIGIESQVTGDDGTIVFTLSAGDYTYLVQMGGYQGTYAPLTVDQQSETVPVSLTPGAGGYLSATFTVTDGVDAVRGATVTVSSVTIDPPVNETTDGSGRAEFYLEAGDYDCDYLVEAVGRLPQSGKITVGSGNISQAITLEVDPDGVALTITGHETGKLNTEIGAFMDAYSLGEEYSVIQSIEINNATTDDTLDSRDFDFFSSAFHGGLRSADLSGTAFAGNAIPQWGFNQFAALTSVTLPDSLTSIGDVALSACVSLKSITLPASVISIGARAFQSCGDLESVTMLRETPPPSIGTDPLPPFTDVASGATVTVPDGCGEAYREFNDGLTTDRYWYGLYIIDPEMPAHLTAGTVERTSDEAAVVTFISDEAGAYYYAVVDHDALEPAIDTEAGTGCSMGSTTVNVSLIGADSGAMDIYIVVKDANDNLSDTLKIEIPMAPLDMVIIDHQAGSLKEEIEEGLDGVGRIRSLKVVGGAINSTDGSYFQSEGRPDGWSIQMLDFSGTTFEDGTITDGLFANYEMLVSISLPSGLTSIGGGAFINCEALKDITLPEGVRSIGNMAFGGCTALEDVALPSGLTSIGDGAFVNCEGLKGIALPEGVTSIGNMAFAGCTALEDITLPEGVTSIGNVAFAGCTALEDVTLPSGLTSIGDGVFVDCEALKDITLPEGVTSIGSVAFAGCTALEDVTLPDGVTLIGDTAFYGCQALTHITLPESVESIGSQAFFGCAALEDVTLLSATPPSVGADAFKEVAAGATAHVPAGSAKAYRDAEDDDTTDNEWFGLVIQQPSAPDDGDEDSAGPSLPQPTVETAGSVTTVTLTAAATADNNGVQASVTEAQVKAAIQMALSDTGDIGTGVISITTNAAQTVSSVTTTAPGAALSAIATNGFGLTIDSPIATITFDSDAISALADQTTADVKIAAAKVDVTSLSDQARQLVGNHPVYDFSVTCGGTSITQFGGDLTVSVPYTPQAGEDPDAIVIYYINAQGVPEMVSDCVYDPETGLVTFHTNHFSEYAVGYNKVVFSDVSADAWYAKAVGFIAARNITTGTGNGNYSPDANLTRGQFLVMVMRAYGIAPDQDSGSNFADAGDTYYTGYLAAAKRLGIASGVGDNLFAPDSDITRQEMFTLLFKALKLNGRLPVGASGKALADFSDADQIDSWAEEAMKLFVTTGTISGSDGKLAPTATASRAEMAQVIYNLLAD